MRNTKTMLVTMLTVFVTWILFGVLAMYCADSTFKEGLFDPVTLVLMLVVGWMPAIVVSTDYHTEQELKELCEKCGIKKSGEPL
jgi:undecaprenyl pyrophosphate phosphatase UppP